MTILKENYTKRESKRVGDLFGQLLRKRSDLLNHRLSCFVCIIYFPLQFDVNDRMRSDCVLSTVKHLIYSVS